MNSYLVKIDYRNGQTEELLVAAKNRNRAERSAKCQAIGAIRSIRVI